MWSNLKSCQGKPFKLGFGFLYPKEARLNYEFDDNLSFIDCLFISLTQMMALIYRTHYVHRRLDGWLDGGWRMAGLWCSWMRNATVFTPVKSRIYSQGQTWKWPLTRQKLETVIYISPLTDPSGTLFMVFIANHYDCPMTYTIYFSLYRARPIERLTSALLWVSASWRIHMWSIRVSGFTNN